MADKPIVLIALRVISLSADVDALLSVVLCQLQLKLLYLSAMVLRSISFIMLGVFRTLLLKLIYGSLLIRVVLILLLNFLQEVLLFHCNVFYLLRCFILNVIINLLRFIRLRLLHLLILRIFQLILRIYHVDLLLQLIICIGLSFSRLILFQIKIILFHISILIFLI